MADATMIPLFEDAREALKTQWVGGLEEGGAENSM